MLLKVLVVATREVAAKMSAAALCAGKSGAKDRPGYASHTACFEQAATHSPALD